MQAITVTPAYNRSEITRNAWEIFRQLGKTFSDAMKAAWAKAREVVGKLNIDVAKLAELSLNELKDLRSALDATIAEKEKGETPKQMDHTIKLMIDGNQVRTTSYYNVSFVAKARNLRGSWNNGQWVFPISVLEHVKNAMLECYSVTGEQPYEVCTVLVKDFSASKLTQGIQLFGRPIAKAWGRDSGAKLAEDIFLLSGSVDSSGSVKNWYTNVENATFEIHNFPVARLTDAKVLRFIEEGKAEVK